jgi:hypothetical protein
MMTCARRGRPWRSSVAPRGADARSWWRGATTCSHALLAGATWCLVASPALAQHAKPGRVEGVVTDSVHSAPLAGALVLLARRTSDTTLSESRLTDSDGRFVFGDLPPGEYVVALESALLDSLELALPSQSVTVQPDDRKHLSLAIPSAATLRTLVCPEIILPAGTGALIGHLTDAQTTRPLGGGVLSVGWSETTVDRATLRATTTPQGADVKADSLGRFRVCGVPTDTYLNLRASLGSHRELLLQLVVPDSEGVLRQDIALSPDARSAESTAELDSMQSPARAPNPVADATLSGIVYGMNAPLARVQVQRRGDSAPVTTDSLGRYRFGAVPVGTQVLEVRRVGYLPRQLTVNVRAGRNLAPDLRLAPIATLDSIRIVAQRSRYREFDSRARAASFGHFLRAEDIARKHPLLTSDLVRQMPGFRIVHSPENSTSDLDVKVVDSRGTLTSLAHSDSCVANIIIDGVPHQMINWIDPGSIGAMEIYPGTAAGPVQYRSNCGTILIWTKRY